MKRKFINLTPIEKAGLIEQLKAQPNMQHFLNHLSVRFDLENCKPGSITRHILATQMVNTVLPMINPTEK